MTELEYVQANISPEPNTGCWLWTKGQYGTGYGYARRNKKEICAHRLAYEVYRGAIPAGLLVCHKCDTPACVNPDHLFLGTQKHNMEDRGRKGRQWQQKKTHCKHGHEFTAGNTYVKRGKRACRSCARRACLAWYYAKRSQNFDL